MKSIKDILKNKKGFIAALDQSGGSSVKTLEHYGIYKDMYSDDDYMFTLIHNMRSRIITSPKFSRDKIIGVILFQDTVEKKVENQYTSEYLLDKGILSFLKIDKGLEKEENGASLMKPIEDLDIILTNAREKYIVGTKMRSLINEYNEEKIKRVVEQQFYYAGRVSKYGLIPIIEPEVNINSKTKLECEKLLKEEILKYLDKINYNVIFKFTLPDIDNFYKDIIENKKVLRVVALSGGYCLDEACKKLEKNNKMIASFSRALLEDLRYRDTKEEFDKKLEEAINKIYLASIS